MNKKISLCITAYDQDYNLIPNLLQIFSHQTISPYELIIYISGINTISLPENIIINNNIVPIIKIVNNQRTIQAVARNKCAEAASGDIVIFFDVDDEPHHQKLEITNILFEKYQPDFMVHNYITTNNKFQNIDLTQLQTKTSLEINPNNTNIYVTDDNGNFHIHHAHIAVNADVFHHIRFDESEKCYRIEDGKFCQDLIKNQYRGIYCTEALVRYT